MELKYVKDRCGFQEGASYNAHTCAEYNLNRVTPSPTIVYCGQSEHRDSNMLIFSAFQLLWLLKSTISVASAVRVLPCIQSKPQSLSSLLKRISPLSALTNYHNSDKKSFETIILLVVLLHKIFLQNFTKLPYARSLY